jgi:predicted RNA-binding protein YlxR (DUF448 family)
MTPKDKHIPKRTCVACRQRKDKVDLIHLVRNHDGNVMVDTSGRIPGRGAYLCPRRDCWEIGIRQNRLEYSMRTKFSSDNRQALIDFYTKLLGGK